MLECVILIGLQGAGKTTFYRRWFAGTHLHISKDRWPNAKRKEARQQQALAEALASGQSVVVDNTNPTSPTWPSSPRRSGCNRRRPRKGSTGCSGSRSAKTAS